MGKISSDTVTANAAVNQLMNTSSYDYSNDKVSFGDSNITSMKNGKSVANHILSDISQMTNCVMTQADKFNQLAAAIESRDVSDAGVW